MRSAWPGGGGCFQGLTGGPVAVAGTTSLSWFISSTAPDVDGDRLDRPNSAKDKDEDRDKEQRTESREQRAESRDRS
jgi:hypothetical protein